MVDQHPLQSSERRERASPQFNQHSIPKVVAAHDALSDVVDVAGTPYPTIELVDQDVSVRRYDGIDTCRPAIAHGMDWWHSRLVCSKNSGNAGRSEASS